jgi:hypothetical protein
MGSPELMTTQPSTPFITVSAWCHSKVEPERTQDRDREAGPTSSDCPGWGLVAAIWSLLDGTRGQPFCLHWVEQDDLASLKRSGSHFESVSLLVQTTQYKNQTWMPASGTHNKYSTAWIVVLTDKRQCPRFGASTQW